VVGTAVVTHRVTQVMVEGAPKATKPEEEGFILRPTVTKTKVRTGPTETAEDLTTGAKRPKEVGLQHRAPANAFDAAVQATSHQNVGSRRSTEETAADWDTFP
jgi:hypothetical protein